MILLLWYIGTARGCGWQKIGAYVNLGAYYLVGLPSAIILTFVFGFGGKVRISWSFKSVYLVLLLCNSLPINCAGTLDGNYMWEWSTGIVAFCHYNAHKLGGRGTD